MQLLCLFFAALVLGSFTLFAIAENYAVLSGLRDTFYIGVAFIIIIFVVFLSALFSLLISASRKHLSETLCAAVAILACLTSFWFRRDLLFEGEKIFFALNQTRFEQNIANTGNTKSTIVVHRKSSHTAQTLFLYAPANPPPTGELSASQAEATGLVGEGCSMDVAPLKGPFYYIKIFC